MGRRVVEEGSMPDHQLLHEALSEFARTFVKQFAISDVLDDLAQRVTVVLGVDGAGVSLREGDRLRFATAVDERATALEQLQEQEQAGPCIDTWRTCEVVAVADLTEVSGRWGAFEEAARNAGIRAVAGIPMRVDGEALGALDLYSVDPRPWEPDDLDAARVLADMATSYVLNASELDRQRRTTEQLQEALDSRVVIEQAKGVLAVRHGVSVDEAFTLLRRHARNHNTHLRAVADAVVNLGLRL
jgi:GAF domain-containing protein